MYFFSSVSATGVPGLIKESWLLEKKEQVFIDASYDPNLKIGDLEITDKVKNFCSAYTPPVGSIGLMTQAFLMQQLTLAAEKHLSFSENYNIKLSL